MKTDSSAQRKRAGTALLQVCVSQPKESTTGWVTDCPHGGAKMSDAVESVTAEIAAANVISASVVSNSLAGTVFGELHVQQHRATYPRLP